MHYELRVRKLKYPLYILLTMKRRKYIASLSVLFTLAGCSQRSNEESGDDPDDPGERPPIEEISVYATDKDFEPSVAFKTYKRKDKQFGLEINDQEEGFQLYVQSVAPRTNYNLNLIDFRVELHEEEYRLVLDLETKKQGDIGADIITYPDTLYKVTEADPSHFKTIVLNVTDGWGDEHTVAHEVL